MLKNSIPSSKTPFVGVYLVFKSCIKESTDFDIDHTMDMTMNQLSVYGFTIRGNNSGISYFGSLLNRINT